MSHERERIAKHKSEVSVPERHQSAIDRANENMPEPMRAVMNPHEARSGELSTGLQSAIDSGEDSGRGPVKELALDSYKRNAGLL